MKNMEIAEKRLKMKRKKQIEYAPVRGMRRGKARACFSALFAALLMLSSCSDLDAAAAQAAFNRGMAAYNALDMDGAKQAFAECCKLNGSLYADAKQYLDGIAQYESLYTQGVAAYEKGDYDAASSAFLGIRGYLNSEEYLSSIERIKGDYLNAVALYEEGEYLKARAAFMQLGDYQRSAAYAANVDSMIGLYNEGIQLMNRNSFLNAARAFNAIKTAFLDSKALIERCSKISSAETVKLGEYINRYNAEYDGGVKIVGGTPGTLFNMRDSRGLIICGAMDESGVVRYISFCIPSALGTQLGADEMNSAFAHCIRALNPELAEHSEILSEISEYTSERGKAYGCMRVHAGKGEDGITVLTAEYEPDDAN